MEEDNKDILIPQPMSDALFDEKITPKQRKFILLLVHSEGLKTATQCAVEAGYAKRSAFMVASRLQNVDKYPHVVKAIDSEVRANVDRYRCTQERSLSTLARIRGQIAGLYVDKKEILTGTIDSMSREEVEKKLQDLKEQYSIETTFEEVKEIENKA